MAWVNIKAKIKMGVATNEILEVNVPAKIMTKQVSQLPFLSSVYKFKRHKNIDGMIIAAKKAFPCQMRNKAIDDEVPTK